MSEKPDLSPPHLGDVCEAIQEAAVEIGHMLENYPVLNLSRRDCFAAFALAGLASRIDLIEGTVQNREALVHDLPRLALRLADVVTSLDRPQDGP